jgi:hypothetical protein
MMRSDINQAKHNAPSPRATEVSRNEKDRITQINADEKKSPAQIPGKQISLNQLINKLNHLNFQDLPISVVFKHTKYPLSLSISAFPMPCRNEKLKCQWVDPIDIEQIMGSYRFQCLHIPKEQQFLAVYPRLKSISKKEAVFILPTTCKEVRLHKTHRYQCNHVSVYMFQNGALFFGDLVEYGSFQFGVTIIKSKNQNFRWIDVGSPVTIVFTKENQTLYSGDCTIIKHDHGAHRRRLNLEPVQRQIRRFEPRQFRSGRQKLNPSLDAVFAHPLLDKTFTLKIINISGSGFAVDEEDRFSVLLPGLMIADLRIGFSDGSFSKCKAQVVYSKHHHNTRTAKIIRSGLAIIEMPVKDHIKLLSLLHQANDAKAYLCNKVDMNALWDFFFETGFIYPQKYEFIKSNKEKIKATFEIVYHPNPNIASHFIYQDNGRIKAHMAMIRFYDAAWLIHHHAAVSSANHRGGLMVLNQVSRFINDSHRLNSMKMDYIFCYYRPDNKFPNHVFGGTTRNIQNPSICSVDNFAYFHFRSTHSGYAAKLPRYWQLAPVTDEDLIDLETFYVNRSGGLMLRSLQLTPEQLDIDELASAYREIGLKRDRKIFALNHRGKMCALVMVNVADIGLNMSDLTNSVQIFVVNDQYITHEIIHTTILILSEYFEIEDIPILFYPRKAATKAGLDYEKTYCLWVYDTHKNLDHYFRFLKRLLKYIRP